ncbi:MAG: HAMP domain-containing histidine kinase, partial [Clostridiales bacterium]|nr:HAMP domain-containing histidine kinase [Clostridiales bacterium]
GANPAAQSDVKTKKPRRRLINTVSRRTTLNYIVFSLILLAVLWIAFFIMLYGFYDTIVKHDIEEVGKTAASAFPKQADSYGMQLFYKHRLPEIARDNSVTVTVFMRNESGEADVKITVDNMGNCTEETSDVFDAVISSIDFNATFSIEGKAEKVETPFGSFLCFGSRHEVKNADGENVFMYMLVLKHYDMLNPQTNKIMYMLIVCTFIVLIFTCVFSYFVSRFQTKQLIDFSQKAKRLADGEVNVTFSGSGYEEFESLATALNAATEKYKQSEKLQRDIIANVSHDIRTPLTMIRAYAEMLRDMPVDEEKRKRTANVIISETERLNALTDDVLNFSKLQSGVAEFKFEPCDVAQIARSTLLQFDIYRERDGIEFSSEIDKKAVVNCDKKRIEQVFYNLIINAINYCGDDKNIIL